MEWKSDFPRWFMLFSVSFYVVMITAEAILGGFSIVNARYNRADTLACLAMAAGNALTGLLTAGLVYAGLQLAYDFRFFTISPADPLAWLAIFFLDDLCYYWFHRISHECRFWWASHVNHHSSQNYNLSTAVRQTWTGNITFTWIIWLPLALLGFPPAMILIEQSISLFYQFWIHTETIGRMPRWFEAVMNTPSHHRVHHASNPRYLDRNYAGIMIIWDRLFGTFAEESPEEKVRYGIVHNIGTHNPLKIAFHEWAAIVRDLAGIRSPGMALGVLFGPPGWKQQETSEHIRDAWTAAQTPSPQRSVAHGS